jgi:hypothetical protein
MKYLYSIFVLLCLFFSPNSFGQTLDQNQTNKENNNTKNFNLPPGAYLKKKFVTDIDLSYKLKGGISTVTYTDSDLKIAKNLSAEELESLKEVDPIVYNYYTSANNFFNSLSSKVKNIYTKVDLWYIYVFDQDLKNQLTAIK